MSSVPEDLKVDLMLSTTSSLLKGHFLAVRLLPINGHVLIHESALLIQEVSRMLMPIRG
jgi:hypothetical protein